jgi:hypothetical protein
VTCSSGAHWASLETQTVASLLEKNKKQKGTNVKITLSNKINEK